MIPGQLIVRGRRNDPRVNFASMHGVTPITVHISCTTQGNPPCGSNVSTCEQNTKVAWARVVLHMLIINVWNKFSNKKFRKAPKRGKSV